MFHLCIYHYSGLGRSRPDDGSKRRRSVMSFRDFAVDIAVMLCIIGALYLTWKGVL